ncbi:MAG: hypothetical protein HC908_04750, partial [Calothrix sp. SM1_7_51]|nr:hypothetical protein [Calothrix sp. SM1_7_51]
MSKLYFSRRILSSLLLASITIATPVSYVGLSSSIVRAKLPDNFDYIRRCDLNEADNSIPVLQEQAIKALDKKELDTSINYIQKILNLSKQSKNFFVLSWLEGDSNGGESNFQRLINLAQSKKQTPKVINLLGQFSEITNLISASSSTSKVDYFVKIAEYFHQISQKEQALKTLNQALQAERFIQGAAFRANASINIARIYIKLGQRATAMKLSAEAEKFIQQIPKASANQKESPLFNLAQVYAQLGADSQLQKLISTQSGNAKNAAINGAVPVYINAKKLDLAETMIKQVKAPEQNTLLLGQIA